MLSSHDSRAAPQTVQTASPVCGTKNFSSVRLYSAPQLHCTIVAIPGICASARRFSSPEPCHNPDPEKAARKLLEIANETEPVQNGRIHIENINGPFLFRDGGSPEPVFRPARCVAG